MTQSKSDYFRHSNLDAYSMKSVFSSNLRNITTTKIPDEKSAVAITKVQQVIPLTNTRAFYHGMER